MKNLRILIYVFVALLIFSRGTTNAEENGKGEASPLFPAVVENVGASGLWVHICAAKHDTTEDGHLTLPAAQRGKRRADKVMQYVERIGSRSVEIDEFVSASPDGRFVAYIKNEELVLLDAVTDRSTNLTREAGANAGDIAWSQAPHRALRFSSDSSSVLFFRSSDQGELVVVRNILPGSESTILLPLDSLPWRAKFDTGGVFVRLQVVDADTNGDGRLSVPTRVSTQPTACEGRATCFL